MCITFFKKEETDYFFKLAKGERKVENSFAKWCRNEDEEKLLSYEKTHQTNVQKIKTFKGNTKMQKSQRWSSYK